MVDPCKRPPVNEIIAHLYSLAQQLGEDLSSEPVSDLSVAMAMWLSVTNLYTMYFCY